MKIFSTLLNLFWLCKPMWYRKGAAVCLYAAPRHAGAFDAECGSAQWCAEEVKNLGTVDLRVEMVSLQVALLCIYNALDGFVLYKIASLLDQRWSSSPSYTVEKAAHALLISHPEAFCRALLLFA